MIRYRQLTDAELAEIGKKVTPSDPERQLRKQPTRVKRSTIKKQHHDRQKDPPPRKIAGRHAAKRTP